MKMKDETSCLLYALRANNNFYIMRGRLAHIKNYLGIYF